MIRLHRFFLSGFLLIAVGTLGCLRVPTPIAVVEAGEPKGRTDAPMFGGSPSRNMINTIDKNLPITWNVEDGKQKNIKWVADLGRPAYGGPVIADGVVYMGTSNSQPRDKAIEGKDKAVLMAFKESDGKFLWQIVHETPDDPIFQMGREEGLCSTPTVDGKKIFYVTPGAEVVCASTAGKVEWKYDMMKELKVVPFHLSNCSPLVVGDLVLVLTGNGTDEQGKVVSPKAPSFIAVNKNTGALVWQSSLPGDAIIEGQWSNPTLATVNGKQQVIFPGGDCVLYSFEPTTGKLIWKCDCFPTRKETPVKNWIYIVSTPVVVGDRLYVGLGAPHDLGTTPKYSYFLCLDVTKEGDVSLSSYDAKAEANKKSALVWAFGGPAPPPVAKGARKINFGTTQSTAAVYDGLIYIAELDGYLHCLDVKTGVRYWVHDFRTSIWGSAFAADGKVYIGTDDSDVTIFVHGKERKYYYEGKVHTPTPADDKKLSPGVSLGEAIQSTPVVANGVLYVATKSKLYAIANDKK